MERHRHPAVRVVRIGLDNLFFAGPRVPPGKGTDGASEVVLALRDEVPGVLPRGVTATIIPASLGKRGGKGGSTVASKLLD